MSARFDLAKILEATGGTARSTHSTHFEGVQTDSRVLQTGSLFVPLKGDRFDGHDFIKQAIGNGAAGVLVHLWSPELELLSNNATLIQVKDTLKALQDLAHTWRTDCGFKVAAITGSNGKTSTKEILAQILKTHFRIHASPGSFNNHWGVPLSLLSAGPDCEVVVQEMGMNHSGEIKRLCEIAEPNVVVVTMVGSAHLGELGSVDAIREAKNEIYKYSPKAKRIYNLDNEQTLFLFEQAIKKNEINPSEVITFSSHNPQALIQLKAEKVSAQGLEISGSIAGVQGSCCVHMFGRHNVVNIMAAAAVALALGQRAEDIFKSLDQLDFSSWGRNQWIANKAGPAILFDGYNANPESMRALLKNLFELEMEGKKAFIFGDMRELGEESEKAHCEIADLAAQVGLSCVWYMGQYENAVKSAFSKMDYRGQLFLSPDFDSNTAKQVLESLKPGDMVALKASRGSRIERVLNSWGVDGF